MSNVKTILVALSTTRDDKRVRFAAGSTVKLTKDELETLDKLTVSTGALHYRDPVNEAEAVDGTLSEGRQYIGEDTPLGKKNVDQLKAFLTFHDVAFEDDAKKADLLAAAEAVDTDADKGDDEDPDAGL